MIAADGHDQVYNSAANAIIEVGYDVTYDAACSPRLLFPIIFNSWAFVPFNPVNVRTKFEVCSFTRSWDNRGYPKIWGVSDYAHSPFAPEV